MSRALGRLAVLAVLLAACAHSPSTARAPTPPADPPDAANAIEPEALLARLPADCQAVLYATGDVMKLAQLFRAIEPVRAVASDAIFSRFTHAAYCGQADRSLAGVVMTGRFEPDELARWLTPTAMILEGRPVYQLDRFLLTALRTDLVVLAQPEHLPRFVASAQAGGGAWPSQAPWREQLAAAELGRHSASLVLLASAAPDGQPMSGFVDVGEALSVQLDLEAKGVRKAKGIAMALRLLGHMMFGEGTGEAVAITQHKKRVRVQLRAPMQVVADGIAHAYRQAQAQSQGTEPALPLPALDAEDEAALRAAALEQIKDALVHERDKQARVLLSARLDAYEGRYEKAAAGFAKWLAASRTRPRDALALHDWATGYAELAALHAGGKREALALLARHEATMLAGNAAWEDMQEWQALAEQLHGSEYTLALYDRAKATVPPAEGGTKLVAALTDLLQEALLQEERFEDLEPLGNALATGFQSSGPASLDDLDAWLLALDVFVNRERFPDADALVAAYVGRLPDEERAHALRFAIGHARSYDANDFADALVAAAPRWLSLEAQVKLAQDLERDAASPF